MQPELAMAEASSKPQGVPQPTVVHEAAAAPSTSSTDDSSDGSDMSPAERAELAAWEANCRRRITVREKRLVSPLPGPEWEINFDRNMWTLDCVRCGAKG